MDREWKKEIQDGGGGNKDNLVIVFCEGQKEEFMRLLNPLGNYLSPNEQGNGCGI